MSFPRTKFIPLDVSFPALPVIRDNGSVLVATARSGCGKVVVIGKMTPLYKKGFEKLLTNCINYLVPADDRNTFCILPGLNPKVIGHVAQLYNDTCFDVVQVNDILGEVEQCAVIVASGSEKYTDDEDAAILEAVSDGAGLLVAGKVGANNDLTESVGITFITGKENRVTSNGVDMDLSPTDPNQCITIQPDYGGETPCNITSIGDRAFVPVEGIGAGYYGAGRIAIIGDQAMLTNLFEAQNNRFLLQQVMTFVSQSKVTCNCTMGCFSRCRRFELFSENYETEFGVTIPVKEVTETCGTCCIALNLRDIDIVDTNMLHAYVTDGGCLFLTCNDRRNLYDVDAINEFLLPFGFEIGFSG